MATYTGLQFFLWTRVDFHTGCQQQQLMLGLLSGYV